MLKKQCQIAILYVFLNNKVIGTLSFCRIRWELRRYVMGMVKTEEVFF